MVPVEEADERIKTSFRQYVRRKGWGKGASDLALLTANANQLHFVLTHPDSHLRFFVAGLLILSILIQVSKNFENYKGILIGLQIFEIIQFWFI